MIEMNHNTHGHMYLPNTPTVCMQEEYVKHGINISSKPTDLYESDDEVINTQLLTLPTSQAGFTPEGKIQKGSVTAIITGALEKPDINTMKESIKQRQQHLIFSNRPRVPSYA